MAAATGRSRGESLSIIAAVEEKSLSPETTVSSPPHDRDVSQGGGGMDPPKKSKMPKLKFPKITMTSLAYRERKDTVLIVIGVITSIILGLVPPLNMLVLGGSIAAAGDPANSMAKINRTVVNFVILAAVGFCAAGLSAYCLETASERQVRQLKYRFLKSILAQDIGYWDVQDTGVLAANIEQSCIQLRDGTGIKLGMVFQMMAGFFGGYVVALIRGWRQALVMMVVTPCLGIAGAVVISRVRQAARRAKASFEQAGAVAEEALPAMRTVASLGIEQHFANKFDTRVDEGLAQDLKAARDKALSVALMFFMLCLSYSLGWWYGSRRVQDAWEKTNGTDMEAGGRVVTVFFAIIIASFSIGQIVPNLNSFITASQAVETAQELINRQSAIDPYDDKGLPVNELKGKIEFRHVKFAYPSRLDRDVYHDVSFTINEGETVALVGPSGCGKSTVVALLQRFYDPQGGEILVDGVNIQEYQLKAYRAQMALVSQEPRLFCDTISRNIQYGKKDPATPQEIENAAKMANAHDFIMSFPSGYETNVGQGGSMLSGGQKQRVAIARAILRDPGIMLLDEATSALDNQSEKIVQKALDKMVAQKKRTTIIIAHRLSTIRYADKILVIDNPDGYGSRVIEQGTHDELMARENGVYQGLVLAQELIAASSDDKDDSSAALAEHENKVIAAELKDQFVETKHSKMSAELERDISKARLLLKYGSKTSRQGSRIGSLLRDESKLSKMSKDDDKAVWVGDMNKKKTGVRAVLKYTKEDWKALLVAVICSVFVGCFFPSLGLLIAQFTGTFYSYDYSKDAFENADILAGKTKTLSLVFVGFSVLSFLIQCGQEYGFGYAGERLIARLRRLLFKKMLHQDMEFFDAPQNTIGTLIAIISADCALMKGVTGGNMSIVFQNVTCLLYAVVCGFVSSPKLAGVAIIGFFLNFATGFLQNRLVRTTQIRPDALEDQQSAGFVMNEAVQGLKVVASYGLQPEMMDMYDKVLKEEMANGTRNSIITGLAAGAANSISYLCNALSFWYGGHLLHDALVSGDTSFTMTKMMRVIFVFQMASNSIGRSVSWVTDRKKAKLATLNILGILNREAKIDVQDESGTTKPVDGDIGFKHLKFRYTHRPEVPVLADVSFQVKKGQTVALVGSSGSGKSTIVQLLERFYDVEPSDIMRVWLDNQNTTNEELEKRLSLRDMFGGVIEINGTRIQDYQLRYWRSQIGLVSQEPVLFQGTVRENIRFGAQDASDEDIEEAAKLANAHEFIMKLPEGYETEVGKGGGHLSGGQKQRVAIARALIRKPKLLILDEATSALDPESEEIVQKALDGLMARSGITTVVIAHRLSTVRNADQIVVFAPEPNIGSRIAEVGTHDELMGLPNGIYRTLVMISQNTEAA
eukprot:Blabericola_migrator_1__1826@NODE_1497_length_4417_cov_420_574943_g983_i0_p1_GENE_NODE_1497_length_4417_cov_420_574943_g983_i0NODE_1497_length_4417_cov_420_574943_g983_i0_p1_ORF_typecomplete_len1438_score345_07ABC_membrane/PF00664_23/4_3e43ABC_membrane/PF00664_23/4_3e47ABC_tran/PF00005_27/4_7e42ABC_tran/PF00005_27/7_9e02ABC_tran/PF00005_27/2_8e41AAA_21/PF13304_6/0_0033AAA_21/PF13304_6/1_1e05SMC_N/PF02463_19/13SMC_N/PF02463_19/1_5e05SMC_N/PF02463_19/1_3e03SMC_N/PF02463_19/65SMC_N/PF02463_19/0_000